MGDLAEFAVTSLLDDAAVAGLIGDIAADLLSGKPVEALAGNVIRTIATDPALQSAVGTAIGEAVGAIFGENLIGAIVGWVSAVRPPWRRGPRRIRAAVEPGAAGTATVPNVWPVAVVA